MLPSFHQKGNRHDKKNKQRNKVFEVGATNYKIIPKYCQMKITTTIQWTKANVFEIEQILHYKFCKFQKCCNQGSRCLIDLTKALLNFI